MNKQTQLSVNLLASIVAFIVNIGISFFLTPYIIKSLGVEAYGFVQLGTNLINYISLLTIALNSMSGRFITIEIHRSNWDAANKYFSSVVITNIVVASLLIVPTSFCVINIDKIIHVPEQIQNDVKVLFFLLLLNFLITIIFSTFSIATFATNKLYLQSLRGIESNLIKSGLIILLFMFFQPTVSYLGIAAVVVVIYTTFFNIKYKRQFLSNIKVKKRYFNLKAVIELISSGIWNTVIHLGNILLQGLNLLIANIFIGAPAMGILAIAITIPQLLSSLIGTVAGVFMPDFTIYYAKNNIEELVKAIKRSMKILGMLTNIPIAILIAFGEDFFQLWVPDQDSQQLQVLSILAISVFVISGSINSLYNVFTVTNKIKVNAIILIFTGLINIIFVYILLKTTDLGLYAVAGVSSVLGILRNLLFTAPFGARYLGLKWNTFYQEIIKSVFGFIIVLVISLFINTFILVENWFSLFTVSSIAAVIGVLINFVLIFNSDERKFFLKIVSKRRRE